MELSDDKNREEAMKKIQRSIIFVIGILLWVMQGQSVFAAGSAELLSGTIANTTISYRLTADGTLTIYSDNIEKMPNYTVNSTVPWAAQKDKIKKVQINSYLKNIGDYAFYGCNSLESVVIQDSKLTEIGIAAFKNCTNLKTINIPETVKVIGTMGFANCNSLQSTKKSPVNIPKGNTEIMDFAFAGCKSMQYIKIPAQIHRILQTICCREVHMSMLCMYTAGRVMKAGQKTMVFPIKLPISTICPVITAITRYI